MEPTYRVGEFAALAGVSVRTLHHYDRLGLLRPSRHPESSYRRYSQRDLLCLQQILTLRYLGMSLKRIRELLGRPEFDLVASLRIQRGVLADRIAELERIEGALGELLARHVSSGRWDWELVARASAAVEQGLTPKGAQMDQYYTPEQLKQFEELSRQVPPEERRAVEEGWAALLADVRAGRALNPASPAAQDMVRRWDELTEATVRGFRGQHDLLGAIGEKYRQGRFEGFAGAPQAEDFAFIERARQAGRGS